MQTDRTNLMTKLQNKLGVQAIYIRMELNKHLFQMGQQNNVMKARFGIKKFGGNNK